MNRLVLILFLCVSTLGCAQKKLPLSGNTEHQREQNAKFKDALKSPLTAKDRKTFRALAFYKVDSAYVVTASFKRTVGEKPFPMKTSTARLPMYVKYGELTFKIKGDKHKLNIYQNVASAKEEGYDGSLFLPFTDHTSGDGSYGGGRYLDTKLPEGNTLIIDFNKAYNPYCAYSNRYSCPVPPRENYIKTRIEAGVKAYKNIN